MMGRLYFANQRPMSVGQAKLRWQASRIGGREESGGGSFGSFVYHVTETAQSVGELDTMTSKVERKFAISSQIDGGIMPHVHKA